jgi:hypothetical protein
MNVNYRIKAIFVLLIVLFFAGCKKDHKILGTDVQPEDDDLNAIHISDLPVTGYTIGYDSVASFNDKYKYIGSNNDPYFGRTDMGLYLSVNLNVTNLNFGPTATLTSAEFILTIDDPILASNYIGNRDAVLTYSVYTMNQVFIYKAPYYTKNQSLHDPNPLPTTSSSKFDTLNGFPVVRVVLDSLYASAMLNNSQYLTDNTTFQSRYKGFYIEASANNGEGVIYRVNTDDNLSGLYLNYKTGNSSTDSITSFKFAIKGSDETTYRHNTVKFTPSPAIQNQFQDSTLGANNLYLKGTGISRLKLQIPFLEKKSDTFDIAVNRAEIIMYVDPAFTYGTSSYSKPPKLTLLAIDTLGRETFITDLLSSSDYARYDGKYDDVNNRYVFNIAREAQLIFRGQKKNRGFYLVVANIDLSLIPAYNGATKELVLVRRDNYFEQVVLAGSNHPSLKPRFNLSYTRFKNPK